MKNFKQDNRLCHVLFLYKEMIPSIRLCGHAQLQELEAQGLLEYKAIAIRDISNEDVAWADVVLLGRLDNPLEYVVVKELHKHKKYIIYVIDDDLLNIPEEFGSAKYYAIPEVKRSIIGMMDLSQAILSPSKVLLKKYATHGKHAILIEEPAIEQGEFIPHAADRAVKIGFAGSVDRTGDIESILENALTKLKQKYGSKIELSFFGAIPFFAQKLSAEVIPYTASYEEYRKQLNNADWDIGLAPMPDTLFHQCKHYNKFVEYAAAGVTGVFSNCGPYSRLEKEIGIGNFCKNETEEWVETLSRLIDDHELRENKRRAAWEYANEKLSAAYIADCLFKENKELFEYRAPVIKAKVNVKRANRIRHFLLRVKLLVRAYGWRLPLHVFRKIMPPLMISFYNWFDRTFPKETKIRKGIRLILGKCDKAD